MSKGLLILFANSVELEQRVPNPPIKHATIVILENLVIQMKTGKYPSTDKTKSLIGKLRSPNDK